MIDELKDDDVVEDETEEDDEYSDAGGGLAATLRQQPSGGGSPAGGGAPRHGGGGIAFDVTLEAGPGPIKATMRQPSLGAGGRPAAAAVLETTMRQQPSSGSVAAAAAVPSTSAMGSTLPAGASTTLNVPAQIFDQGTPLSNKVDKLRAHLVNQLGGPAAFSRVYDYVSREESGEQQSG